MKKIIFIELLHHHECIENPYLYFKSKWYETKAILWEFVHKQIKNIRDFDNEFYTLDQPVRALFPRWNFFKKIKYILNEFREIYKNTKEIKKILEKEKTDYVYINTIESPFLIPLIIYLLWLKEIKIYTAIHNTNRLKVWFLKYFTFDFLIKKLIKKSYKIVLLWKYLKFKDKNIQNKVVYFNNRIIKEVKAEKFKKTTFVISWSLDTRTKDYKSVLKWFWKFLKENSSYKSKVQLVLLWQIKEDVSSWINEYNLKDIVKTFDHYVWEKDMEKYMWGAHYSIISTFKDSIYWKYKISWSFWDAVWFNVPIILSENYAPDYINKDIIRFKNSEFDKILNNILK